MSDTSYFRTVTAPNESAPGEGQTGLPAGGDVDGIIPDDPDGLLLRIQEWYTTARDHRQEWRQEAAECFDFVAGHQWSEEDMEILREQLRPAVTFNRVAVYIDAVGGLEIGNRQETNYIPRQLGSQGVSDILTAADKWCRDECDAEDEESDQFRDAVICGEGWTDTRMNYDDDPDGMVMIQRVDPTEVFPDPTSRKSNYADSRFVLWVKDMPLLQARDMFPGVPDHLLDAKWADDRPDEARTPHNARLAPFYRIDQSGRIDEQRLTIRIVEAQWWEFDTAYRVLDPATGRFIRLDEKKFSVYKMRAQMLGIAVQAKKDRTKVYKKAIVGAVVLSVSDGPEKGGFTLKCITGKRDRNKGCWYGLVRHMRDPQMWANKWLAQSLYIINTNAKGGLLAEENAFVNPNQAEDSWSSPESITWLKSGGLQRIQQKEPPQFPPMIAQLMEFAVNSIPQINGVNPEMLGQSQTQQPQAAVLEMGRKQQGMTVLADMFNSKRRYQKQQGRLMLWLIQTFISDGRLIRIGGPENARYVPLIHTPGLAEYDVIVDDAPSSPNMKERVWAAIMQMFPMLSRLPVMENPQFLTTLLKYAPFPDSFVNDISKAMQQGAAMGMQGQQSAQAVNQARAQLHAAQAAHWQAKTQALGPESQANVEAKRAAAVADLAKVGIEQDDQRLDAAQAAVDALLRGGEMRHDQAMDHAQLGHELVKTVMQHQNQQQNQLAQPQAAQQAQQPAQGAPKQ